MKDGYPHAWNPGGTTNQKTGVNMWIGYSDLQRASNSWFGDAYGTVTVYCIDGEGNEHRFYSTTMNMKAKVFFPPDVGANGLAPSQSNPPCWYLFWQNGAVPTLPNFSYNHTLDYGQSAMHPYWFDSREVGPLAGPTQGFANSGTHYPGGMLINGIEFGGATGIDCCQEVVAHEDAHNFYVAEIHDGAADTDPSAGGDDPVGDLVADSREAAFGASTTNPDTFNLAVLKASVYARYGDGEYRVMLDARGQTGVASKDWSKGGKQW